MLAPRPAPISSQGFSSAAFAETISLWLVAPEKDAALAGTGRSPDSLQGELEAARRYGWCRGPESDWLRRPFQGRALPVSYLGTGGSDNSTEIPAV